MNYIHIYFLAIARALVMLTLEEMQCLFCLVIRIQGVPRRAKTSQHDDAPTVIEIYCLPLTTWMASMVPLPVVSLR